MAGAIAIFNYSDWSTLYPEFSNVTQPQATAQFGMAGLYLRNDGTGPVCDVNAQTSLLYLLTAHLCFLAYGNNSGAGGSQLVGRITGATEGSVSVQADYPSNPSNAWFIQSRYGAEYFSAIAAFRTMRYRPGPGAQGFGLGAGFGPFRLQPWVYPNDRN